MGLSLRGCSLKKNSLNWLYGPAAALALAPFAALSGQSRECSGAIDPIVRSGCLLRDADSDLNKRYEDLRRKLGHKEAATVQSTQRDWLKQRDSRCRIRSRAQSREKWIDDVARDPVRADCVLQMTEDRIGELARMQQEAGAPVLIAKIDPPANAPVTASGDASTSRDDPSGRTLRSAHTRNRGRHYFEVIIEPALIRGQIEANLSARVNDGERWVGTVYEIKPQDVVLDLGPNSGVRIVGGNLGDIRLPKVIIGVAADLDAGQLYWHRDGAWDRSASPGSSKGIPLRRDGDFRAEVSASTTLRPLIDQGVVAPNFGERPFAHPLPVGYRGFDSAKEVAVVSARAKQVAVFSPGERVAGTDQKQWVRRFWEWGRSFPADESPSADFTGHRCGSGQSGPVWFLTGTRESKPVSRECEVPAGKILLIPLVNTLAQVNPGQDVACDRILVSLGQFASGVTDLRLTVDGAPVDSLERFRLTTECFTLRDVSRNMNGLAAGTGYWVFMKPLPKGRHVLEFGGVFTTHAFRQDVRYVLHVQ